MGGFDLFAQLFHSIDSATSSFVTTISSNVITTAMPVITAGLTLTFIFYGLLVARGVVDDSLKDFFFKCFKIGIIVSIASAGGLYQSQIASAIQKTPDEFATALLPASAQASTAQGGEAASVVDNAAKTGFAKAEDAFDKASIFHPGSAFVFALFGLVCILATALLTAIGGAFILLAKVALALLAGLGPLFILALLFKSTARFFEAWCAQVLTYGLLVLMVSSVFGLMMQIFSGYMAGMAFDGVQNVAMELGGCVILSIACIIIVIQLPTIAGSLANGVGIGLWHEGRIALGIGSKSVKGAAGAVRGGVAAGKAAYGGGKAAAGAVGRAVGRFRGSNRQAA
jgi:type IV secretion system protein VirB6